MTELKVRPEIPLLTRTPAAPWPRRRLGHPALIGVALVLWAASLPAIDLDRMNGFGLISVLPAGFFVAIGLLCLGFGVGVVRRTTPRMLLAYPFAMLAVLHLVVPLVYDEPRYSYVYKHVAVVRYISEFGGIDRSVDIYHNWPGIFAAAAVLSDVTGVDPAAFANWADPVFACCGALAVYFVARSLTTDDRRVAITVWLYVITSCGSQVYFAPQSLAYFLALVAMGVAVRWLGSRSEQASLKSFLAVDRRVVGTSLRVLGRLPWLGHLRLLPDRQANIPGPVPPGPAGMPVGHAVAVLVLLASAVVVTHQLTPFFLTMGLATLFAAGRLRAWLLPVLVAGAMALWIYLSYDYVSLHFTLFAFDPFDNVKGAQASIPAAGSPEYRIVGQAARVMAGVVLGLAAVSWWLAPRGRRETFVWVLALSPAVVLLVQSYGGEAIYRVVMFMLPWVCFLGSRILTGPWQRRRSLLSTGVVALGSVLVSLVFLLNYFGLDRVNYIQPQEVRASEWFEYNAPPGTLLAYLTGYWPTPATASYAEHLNIDGNWGGGVFSDTRFEGFAGRALTAADIPGILEIWTGLSRNGQVYVAIGPTQIAAVETYGYSPPGTIEAFVDALLHDPRLRIVHQDGDAYVLEVLPVSPT